MKNVFVILVTLSILLGCNSNKSKETNNVTSKFCIPDSLISQIELDTVSIRPLVQEFNLIGKVTYDQDKVVKLYPLVSGNVLEVKVALGDQVEKGQVLAVVKSGEIAGAENDIVSADANLAIAEKNLEAAEDLYKSGIASEKDYLAAVKETTKSRSELSRVKTILSIFGGSKSEYVIKSPVSGYIVEKNINPEMQIRPDNSINLFTISNLKKVWVLANVYESEIANIKAGEKVNIFTISYPGKKFAGIIDKIYNVLDPDSKTMKVRVQLDNKDNLLKPEMFAKVIVQQLSDSSMIAVPSKSTVFDQNKYWVIIYDNQCNVQSRMIDIAYSTNSLTYIRSGVKPGEKIITNVQLLIYNAINQ
jgi:cobalt-zinc-cadmium efflux system membrane fusion protein